MERSDILHRLAPVATNEANSDTIDGVETCVDILRYLKSLNLSAKHLSNSKVINPLHDLTNHENPKIRTEANLLFTSWIKQLFLSGTDVSSKCNKAVPVTLKKPSDVVKVCSVSNKQQSHDIQKKKQSALPPKCCSVSRMKQSRDIAVETKKQTQKNQRSQTREAMQIDGCKSFSAKSIQKKKQSVLTKKQQPTKVSEAPKRCPALTKNSTEMLELFEVAKKSADVANAKGILLSKAEISICVDTLALLLSLPISSTAPETRKIMQKLEHLTKHKDRKICNSASTLLYHWRRCITN